MCLAAYLLFGVFLLKLLYPALGIHDLLFPREEGMTFRADVEMDFFSCRPGRKDLAAGAVDLHFFVFRVNSFLQFCPPEIRY